MTLPLIHPYLFFGGRCEEAFAFYQKAVGAEIGMLMRHSDSPDPAPPGMLSPGFEDKIMHGEIRIGGSTVMASDGCGEAVSFNGFSLALSLETASDAERVFNALAEGGEITMPLAKTFWSPSFGMLTDQFGLGWMIMVATAETTT